MFVEEARLASFASSAASSSKKKQASKAWPHATTGRGAKASGIPLPATLAKAGFYHAPSEDAPDGVTHFLYPDVTISDWKAGDDPLVRLDEVVPANGWCKIFWSLDQATHTEGQDWTWTRPDLLPTSKEMTEARKQTFGSQWPYDGKKGWKPTSKKLAEAGFYFNPTEEEEDSATCFYCKKSLGGWEKGDDPTHEHKKRMPQCPFFNCALVEPEVEKAAEHDAEEADAGIQMPKRGKRVVSATARKASARVPKSKAAKDPTPEAEEPSAVDEPIVDDEPAQAAPPPPRSMRAASRRATKAIEILNSDTDINRIPRKEEVAQIAQETAALGAIPFPTSEADHVSVPEAVVSKAINSRSKNKAIREATPPPLAEAETTVIERPDESADEQEQVEEEPVEEAEEPKRRSRARPAKASSTTEVVAAAAPVLPAATRTRKVSKKAVPPEPQIEILADADVDTPAQAEIESEPSKVVSDTKSKKKKPASSRSTAVQEPKTAEVLEPLATSDPVKDDADTELTTAASQATIRATRESAAPRSSLIPEKASRSPLSQLSQLEALHLDDQQRGMTVGLWLQYKADLAAQEMRETGLAQLRDLENQMQTGRLAVERALRGQSS